VAEHDAGLADVFNSDNPDAHTRNAELWQVARNVAKTLIFLLIYGGQPALMVKRKLFATLAQAKAAFENVKQEQPSIDRLMQNVIKKAAKTGTIRTVGGRQLRYPDLTSPNRQERKRAERQCFNALIQGSARDIMHRLVVESLGVVKAAGACFINLVHDELLVEVPAEAAPALQEQLNSIWQKRPDLLPGVLVNGDWNIGNSWYEAK
jgi:DNA polymerase-1